jgi:hypothetical protein
MRRDLLRRTFLRGAGGAALALPLLESAARGAAAPGAPPLRLVIYVQGEGNLSKRWPPPTLANDALQLSEMLQPLAAHQQKLTVISGVSNKIAPLHTSNGHNAPGHTIMTAALVDTTGTGAFDKSIEVKQGSLSLGPSIDHYVADQLKLKEPINLAVGGPGSGENQMWYKVKPTGAAGANPVAPLNNDPINAFQTYLAGLSSGPPMSRADRFHSQKKSVLDGVLSSFNSLKAQVGTADRLRLQMHADAIRSIEQNLTYVPPVQCSGLTQMVPPGYKLPRGGPYTAMDVQANLMIDVMVNALACGASRLMTLQDTEYDSPQFEFLPVGPVKGWHAQVHNDAALGLGYASNNDNPTLKAGFLYYASVFNRLLDKMDAIVEPNGATMLDNSLVLWIAEFGDGQTHNPANLPVVLAGGAQGQIKTNRHLAVTATTGDLYTSILNVFGVQATTFGYNGASGLNSGGISGLIA